MTDQPRSALVTGASRGIGLEIAMRLARMGCGLTVTSRSADDLAALVDQLKTAGAQTVRFMAADMADRASLPALVDLHAQHFGVLDALILNAGVGTGGAIATYPMARFDKTVQVNFGAAFVLLQAAIPLLRKAAAASPERGAKIIGLSSITGAHAERGLAVYGATKAAMLSLMETVNLEESPHGVTATAIAPAYVDTDMSAWVKQEVHADTMIPVEDVASVVELILSLSPRTSISRIVLSRSATSGYCA
jgi:3-oxoacyl-[acyl-carrier protein] reductase